MRLWIFFLLFFPFFLGATYKKNEKKVRIPLLLSPYPLGKTYLPKAIHRIFRAKLKTRSHFYLDNWHISTKPIYYNKLNGKYSINITFFKLSKKKQGVEKKFGTLTLQGYLKGKKPFYLFSPKTKKIFRNKQKKPLIRVVCGHDIWPKSSRHLLKRKSFVKKSQ